MAEEQQLSPKDQLIALIRSAIAANTSGDPILIQYANTNLGSLLERIDVTETTEDFE